MLTGEPMVAVKRQDAMYRLSFNDYAFRNLDSGFAAAACTRTALLRAVQLLLRASVCLALLCYHMLRVDICTTLTIG